MKQQRIVCAANRDCYGNIILGVRHWDSIMHMNVLLQSGSRTGWSAKEEQGFIDNQGNFLSRLEAWIVAEAAGQILYRCGGDTANGGTLFSENLY